MWSKITVHEGTHIHAGSFTGSHPQNRQCCHWTFRKPQVTIRRNPRRRSDDLTPCRSTSPDLVLRMEFRPYSPTQVPQLVFVVQTIPAACDMILPFRHSAALGLADSVGSRPRRDSFALANLELAWTYRPTGSRFYVARVGSKIRSTDELVAGLRKG